MEALAKRALSGEVTTEKELYDLRDAELAKLGVLLSINKNTWVVFLFYYRVSFCMYTYDIVGQFEISKITYL